MGIEWERRERKRGIGERRRYRDMPPFLSKGCMEDVKVGTDGEGVGGAGVARVEISVKLEWSSVAEVNGVGPD